jgi:hypothetical protein
VDGVALGETAGDSDFIAPGASGDAAGVSEPEPQAPNGKRSPITETTAINLLFINNYQTQPMDIDLLPIISICQSLAS